MLKRVIESLNLIILVTAYPIEKTSDDDMFQVLAEAAAPFVHGIVAAGSRQCETLKQILGVSYDQIQAKNTPDTDASLTINLISNSGVKTYNMSSAKTAKSSNDFDSKNELVILIHGFMESSKGMMVKAISEPLLHKQGYTLMALDGGDLIKVLYFRSTTYVRFMGEKLGHFLADLVEEGQDPRSITIVGHSLGAHIAGISGKTFQNITGSGFGRITGLDPAGPCFTMVDEDSKLKRGDAEYVDVIHTDGGLLGLKEPIGDKDFFPNGGSVQPGCVLPPCCHSRAWQYYADSVRNVAAFPARLCNDWDSFRNGSCADNEIVYMGPGSKNGVNGSYYLSTNI